MEEEKVCCLCGCKFVGWGNNPWPADKISKVTFGDGETCCDECNSSIVIPLRLLLSR